jgi:hypothetical protein
MEGFLRTSSEGKKTVMAIFLVWVISASLTIGFFTLLSLVFDGRVSMSSWIRLALATMSLLGPAGTLLTIVFLLRGAAEVSRELREIRRCGSPGPALKGENLTNNETFRNISVTTLP